MLQAQQIKKLLFLAYLLFLIFLGSFSIYQLNYSPQDPLETLLVDVQEVAPTILIDLKYTTPNNFTHQVIYDFKRCLLTFKTAQQLAKVQSDLEKMGLGLKIWDGYRPIAAQFKMWEVYPNSQYVCNPKEGGKHTRGTSVDVTLVDSRGFDLPMPSSYDDFSECSHCNYQGASKEALQNRDLLRKVMEKHGFIGFENEWWHFDLAGWENIPPQDFDVRAYCTRPLQPAR